MSRVLLMIENGDGRVKCAGRVRPWGAAFGTNGRRAVHASESTKVNERCYWHTTKQRSAKNSASRWWLVEAASADAARHCIAGGCEPYLCHRADGPLHCRILAQGGRQ